MDSMDDEHTSDAWLGDGGMAEVKVAIEKVRTFRQKLPPKTTPQDVLTAVLYKLQHQAPKSINIPHKTWLSPILHSLIASVGDSRFTS